MLVRIRRGIQRETASPLGRKAALAVGSLLTPCALVAFTMAFWSMAATLRWTGDFVISHGVLSHWEVWLTASAVLLFSGRLLSRYAGTRQSFGNGDRGGRS